MTITITAFANSPDRGRGLARDMRVRWALEEVGQPYAVRLLSFKAMKEPAHLALQPFGQIPTYEEGDLALFESGAIVLHVAARHADRSAAAPFLARWRARTAQDSRSAAQRAAAMRAVNPALIPRNHRIEAAIAAAVEEQDFSLFEAMNTALARPYDDQPGFAAFAEPPKPGEEVLQIFCGT